MTWLLLIWAGLATAIAIYASYHAIVAAALLQEAAGVIEAQARELKITERRRDIIRKARL